MIRNWLNSTVVCVLAVLVGTGVASAGPNQPRAKGVPGAGRPDPERMKKLIEKFDKDGDGKLSEAERQAARAARGNPGAGGSRPDPARMKKLVEKFDKDGDGKLSEAERQAARAAAGKFRNKAQS